MAYALKQDLIDRFGSDELIQLTDRTNAPQSTIDDTVVGKALGDADAMIDSYIGRRYDLPLPSVPARLVQVASEIARYFLHKDGPTDKVKADYEAATRFLRDVSTGTAILDIGGSEPVVTGDTAKIASQDRVFSRDRMKGF